MTLSSEMYGFPLTIYLLTGWLGGRSPDLDLFSDNAGHPWSTVLRVGGDARFSARIC